MEVVVAVKRFFKDILKYFDKKNRIDILLVGQTGSGKTTFLDLLVNYIQYGDNINEYIMHSDVKNENINNKNESQTQKSKNYYYDYENIKINIIDTPGLGDTRGFEQDKENIKLIVDKLKETTTIDIILIVANGTHEKI